MSCGKSAGSSAAISESTRHLGGDIRKGPVGEGLGQTRRVARLEKMPRRYVVDPIVPVGADRKGASKL